MTFPGKKACKYCPILKFATLPPVPLFKNPFEVFSYPSLSFPAQHISHDPSVVRLSVVYIYIYATSLPQVYEESILFS